MQGRLLPKYIGRYQAHPVGYWQDEFPIASKLGLKYIEFIFDYNDAKSNPLLSDSGLRTIIDISKYYNIEVKTVCADYFMDCPIYSKNEKDSRESIDMLHELINQCSKVGISDIIIPCVDNSTLNDEFIKIGFIDKIIPFIDKLENLKINLCLETDLPPQEFIALISKIDSSNITINYDLGNSSSLGYNIAEEFDAYGQKITDIHIKDRVYNGESVFLGKGHASFNSFFKALNQLNYKGPYIMQAYRDEEGVEIFDLQLKWLKNEYNNYISSNQL